MKLSLVLKRVAQITGIIISTLIVLVVILICISDIKYFRQEAYAPEICRNLPRNGGDAKAVFSERVIKKFPAAEPVDELMKSLESQGFHRSTTQEQISSPTMMYFDLDYIPCDYSWVIRWTNGLGGVAQDIKGEYSYTCL